NRVQPPAPGPEKVPLALPVAVPAVPSSPSGRAEVLPRKRLGELAGTTLSHFDIGSVLAEGKTGLIFRARDTKTDREVALKVLWPELAQDEEEIQRFIRAVKTMLPLRHPNLVTLYGAGKTSSYCWISMARIEGRSLADLIRREG